jgi:hypothetical protein
VRDAGGPDLEDRVSASPAWRQLHVACAGDEPRALVAEAVPSRLLDGRDPAQDPAAVLAWRIPRLVEVETWSPDEARHAWRPPWLAAPTRAMAQDPVGRWAFQQDQLIAGRVQALVTQVAADPPTWSAGVRPRPGPGAERALWEGEMGVVVAYRDQFRITDAADPVGTASGSGHQQQARLKATDACQRVQGLSEPAPVRATANERLRALALAQHEAPIAAGDALRRVKAAQLSADRMRASDSSRLGSPTNGPRL